MNEEWQSPETAPEGELVWIVQPSPTAGQFLYDSARVKKGKFKIGRDTQIGVLGWMKIAPFELPATGAKGKNDERQEI